MRTSPRCTVPARTSASRVTRLVAVSGSGCRRPTRCPPAGSPDVPVAHRSPLVAHRSSGPAQADHGLGPPGDHLTPVDVLPFAITQSLGFLVNLLLINLWEETAWAGFVQTRLERRHRLPIAAILTAIPFALIHMPLHFIGDFTRESLAAALVTLLIVSILVRLLLGVVLRGTRDRILAVAVLHTVFNRSNNDEGVLAGLLEGQAHGLAGLLAVILFTTTVAIIARHRLNRADRAHLDTANSNRSELCQTVNRLQVSRTSELSRLLSSPSRPCRRDHRLDRGHPEDAGAGITRWSARHTLSPATARSEDSTRRQKGGVVGAALRRPRLLHD